MIIKMRLSFNEFPVENLIHYSGLNEADLSERFWDIHYFILHLIMLCLLGFGHILLLSYTL